MHQRVITQPAMLEFVGSAVVPNTCIDLGPGNEQRVSQLCLLHLCEGLGYHVALQSSA